MSNYPKSKRIWFTEAQANALERLAQDPAYRYNGLPSENMVIREAFDFFLSAMSKNLDNKDCHAPADSPLMTLIEQSDWSE